MTKFKTFIAAILSVLVIIALIGFTGCYTIKHHINSEMIKQTITDNDFSGFLDNVYQEHQDLLENTKEVFNILHLPEDAIEQIINTDATKNFLGIYVANSVDAILGEKTTHFLTKEDLKSLLKDNLDILQQNMPSEEKNFLENYENKAYEYPDIHGDEIISYFPNPQDILKEVNQDEIKITGNISLKDAITILNFISNSQFLLIYAISILIILLLIYLLKRPIQWSKYFTFIFTSYAFIMIAVEIIILTIIKKIFMNELDNIKNIINYLINGVSKTLWLFIIPAIILAIISYIFYRKKKEILKHAQVSNKLSN